VHFFLGCAKGRLCRNYYISMRVINFNSQNTNIPLDQVITVTLAKRWINHKSVLFIVTERAQFTRDNQRPGKNSYFSPSHFAQYYLHCNNWENGSKISLEMPSDRKHRLQYRSNHYTHGSIYRSQDDIDNNVVAKLIGATFNMPMKASTINETI
jgi:hypothetical protein